MRPWSPYVLVSLLVLTLATPGWAAPSESPTQVAVLATAHQLHEELPGYSFADLQHAIERLDPDVLCIEVTESKFAQRSPESNKREYPAVIYPLIDRNHVRVYTMEPAEPLFSDILKPYLAANQAFRAEQPEQAAILDTYIEGAYAALRTHWTSSSRANDSVTDDLLRAKHALQQSMIGEGERVGWQRWNQHFLEVITRAVAENPGKRIVVTVGADHGYWLREHLAQLPGVTLLDTAELLRVDSAVVGSTAVDKSGGVAAR